MSYTSREKFYTSGSFPETWVLFGILLNIIMTIVLETLVQKFSDLTEF